VRGGRALTLAALLLLVALPTLGEEDDGLEAALALEKEIAAVVGRVRPAVVAIATVAPPDETGRRRTGSGSGILISKDGLVLTNHHVAGEAERITVVTAGNRRRPAKVVGTDPEGDLALLRIDGGGPWPQVEMGDSDSLRVGQWVFAMGNPRGASTLDGEAIVTWGAITALHCLGGGMAGGQLFYGDAIQTDAELNPGNSGGPLFDLDGRLIGINGRIATRNRVGGAAVNANVGFAIPVNQVRRFLPLLEKGEKIRHGFLGVRTEEADRGVRILFVAPGSAAAAAGIEPGDHVVALDGVAVATPVRLTNLVNAYPAGEKIALRVRRNGAERIVVTALGARPEGTR
jgi:S1-C subfamily serine protease